MVEPYAAILRELQSEISILGFHLGDDTNYQATYVREDWQILFRTERHYQPPLDIWIRHCSSDGAKGEFAVWLLAEIFAPNSMRNARAGDTSLRALLDMGQQQVQFLSRYRDQVFIVPPAYAEEYRLRNESPN